MEKIIKISEHTLIPISMVIVLFGFVSWLTALHAETKSHGTDITEIKEYQKVYNEKLDRILEQLGNIQGQLGIKVNR